MLRIMVHGLVVFDNLGSRATGSNGCSSRSPKTSLSVVSDCLSEADHGVDTAGGRNYRSYPPCGSPDFQRLRMWIPSDLMPLELEWDVPCNSDLDVILLLAGYGLA